MVETAIAIGLEYLGISDHCASSVHPDGLDPESERFQRDEVTALRREFPEFTLLHGVEVDARPDGALTVPEERLAGFDYVLVSLHEDGYRDAAAFTDAVLRIVDQRYVNIVSKPLGGYMLRKPPLPLDLEAVLRAAGANGTAVELNANPQSLDLDHNHCALAFRYGVKLVINTDAHRAARLVDFRHGVEIARDARVRCDSLINTMTVPQLQAHLARKR